MAAAVALERLLVCRIYPSLLFSVGTGVELFPGLGLAGMAEGYQGEASGGGMGTAERRLVDVDSGAAAGAVAAAVAAEAEAAASSSIVQHPLHPHPRPTIYQCIPRGDQLYHHVYREAACTSVASL